MRMTSKLYIQKAGRKGRGVFTHYPINVGEVIEFSPYIEIPAKDYKYLDKSVLGYYWYEVKGYITALGLGYTSLYNHSKRPNAEFNLDSQHRTITIKALKRIGFDEEITIDYGYNLNEYLKDKK